MDQRIFFHFMVPSGFISFQKYDKKKVEVYNGEKNITGFKVIKCSDNFNMDPGIVDTDRMIISTRTIKQEFVTRFVIGESLSLA